MFCYLVKKKLQNARSSFIGKERPYHIPVKHGDPVFDGFLFPRHQVVGHHAEGCVIGGADTLSGAGIIPYIH